MSLCFHNHNINSDSTWWWTQSGSTLYMWRMFLLTICWNMGSLVWGEKAEFSTSSSLSDYESWSLSALGQADILQLPPHFLLWRRGLLSDTVASHTFSMPWLASKWLSVFAWLWDTCTNELLYKVCIILNVNLYGYTPQVNIFIFKHEKKVIVLWHPSCWLHTHSVRFMTAGDCQCHRASVCMYATSVYQQERGNQLLPMMSCYSLPCIACTNQHRHI